MAERKQFTAPVKEVEHTEIFGSMAEAMKVDPSITTNKEFLLRAIRCFKSNGYKATVAMPDDSGAKLQELEKELGEKRDFIRGLQNVIEEQKGTIESSHNQNIELAQTNAGLQSRLDAGFVVVKENMSTSFFEAMERRVSAGLSKSPEDFINQLFVVAKKVVGPKELL